MKANHKPYPFLTLCLSMVWVSIAVEMVNFTDGRPSFTGNLVMQCMVAGLLLWGVCEFALPKCYARGTKHLPVVSAVLCAVLPFLQDAPLYFAAVVVYGISCGGFMSSSLTEYLNHSVPERRLVQIGISAGICTTAVYPFGAVYTLLAPHMAPNALRVSAYMFLCALALVVALLRRHSASPESAPPAAPPLFEKRRGITAMMLVLIVLFTVFNHFLLFGVLEQNGGTVNSPWIYFLNVALRLPMGFLMGWFAYKGRWYYAVGLPLGLMVTGCAISLLAGDTPVGDYAMMSLFNCGGAGFVMFIHILGMQAALWRRRRALTASFGSLVHYSLTSFFTVSTLQISPDYFGQFMRQPLTVAVIVFSVPLFLLVMMFLVNHKLMRVVQDFFSMAPEVGGFAEPDEKPPKAALPAAPHETFSPFERKIAALLIDGLSQREIARKFHLTAAEVEQQIHSVRDKITRGEADPTLDAIAQQYKLTRREQDMLCCVRQGMTNAEIATDLFLSEETVRIHVRNLIRKLPLESRQDVGPWVDTFKVE